MSNPFKVGDSVKCIDDFGLESYLTIGEVYKVVEVIGKHVKLLNFMNNLNHDRFVLDNS